MLENIKRIGLFMIVAQTFIQFAAGKQYEKYMKIISGVIVLLMFVSPFASSQDNLVEQWEEQIEKMTEKIGSGSIMSQKVMVNEGYGASGQAIQQLEEEIKTKLNYEMEGDDYKISDVTIEWEKVMTGGTAIEQELSVKMITITLQQTDQGERGQDAEDSSAPIVIERIQIGLGTGQTQEEQSVDDRMEYDAGQGRKSREYRDYFAEILGVNADKVEVVYGG